MSPAQNLTTPTTPRTAGASAPDGPDAPGLIDLWSVQLEAPGDDVVMAMLDREERARAERFRFARDRDRYLARRVFLRQVLAGYVDTMPSSVRISRTRQGKPRLDASWGVEFSASHSDGRAVVAVSRSGRIGVDIERLRRFDDALDLAETHMTARELAWLRSVPMGSRSSAFLGLWTRKEAAVKAIGVGLSLPLDRLDTGAPGPDGVSRPSGLPDDPAISVAPVAGLHGFVAAVALEGHRPVIRHMAHWEVAA